MCLLVSGSWFIGVLLIVISLFIVSGSMLSCCVLMWFSDCVKLVCCLFCRLSMN